MNFKEIIKSKNAQLALEIVMGVLVLVIVFTAGVLVGLEKARYSYNWGENRYNAFAGPPGFFLDRNYLNAHGLVGNVLQINGDSLVVQSPDNMEKIVETTNQTMFRSGHSQIGLDDLKVNDDIAVIGSPGPTGEMEAVLIRVLQPPPPFKQPKP